MIHLEGAQPLATFERDFYVGRPAVTERRLGEGRVIYVGTARKPGGPGTCSGGSARTWGLGPAFPVPEGWRVTRRWRKRLTGEDEALVFVLNHNAHPVSVRLPGSFVDLPPSGAALVGSAELPARGVWAQDRAPAQG